MSARYALALHAGPGYAMKLELMRIGNIGFKMHNDKTTGCQSGSRTALYCYLRMQSLKLLLNLFKHFQKVFLV
jgi:hypothetical protein